MTATKSETVYCRFCDKRVTQKVSNYFDFVPDVDEDGRPVKVRRGVHLTCMMKEAEAKVWQSND